MNKENKCKHLTFHCDKCNSEPEIDKEKSNNNWTVYKTNKKCVCGGVFKLIYK